ncbi:MAG: helix-turn-helix domain-containing protein [Chitinophagaceae bacterium]|nr:helix-turn-helix domain-containing protein [Chitinophagaceae bacterium]MCW5928827.1 helix-turn-helix domain-containing protein [Chitinophagaceae bacterium]
MTLGEFLRAYRKHYKYSVKRLSEIISVNQYRLQKWEVGISLPKYEDSEKLKEFFGLPSFDDIPEDFLQDILKHGVNVRGVVHLQTRGNEIIEVKRSVIEAKDRKIRMLEEKLVILQEKLEQYKKGRSHKKK